MHPNKRDTQGRHRAGSNMMMETNWSDVATSQGISGATKSKEKWEEFSLRAFQGGRALQLDFRLLASETVRR